MGNFNSQGLANAAWAFAKADQSDASLFAALAAAAEQRMGNFNSQELANAAWAFATADQTDASLFAALATVPPFSVAWETSLAPVVPSLRFWAYFSITFQDRIFWILELISGGFWAANLDIFRYFSLSFFGIIFGLIFSRCFIDFGALEP